MTGRRPCGSETAPAFSGRVRDVNDSYLGQYSVDSVEFFTLCSDRSRRCGAVDDHLLRIIVSAYNYQGKGTMAEATPPSGEVSESPETPEIFKHILWVWHHSQRHRKALMKPPVLMAYLVIALAAFWLGSSRKAEEINIKNERISFLNDQLAAYKDRLQGATPDQAAKQLVALQTEVEAYAKKFDALFPEGQRKLSEKQLKILSSHKDEMLKFSKPLMVFSGVIGDTTAYTQEFLEFFKSQNVPTLGPVAFPCFMGERGLLVGIKGDITKPPEDAKAFIKMLDEAGLYPRTTQWSAQPDTNTLDFDLYVCPPF